MKKLHIIIFILLWVISCKQEEQYQYANLSLKLAATPANYEKVVFDIESIKLYFEVPSESSQWITINDVQKGVYNLIDYVNGKSVLVASTPITQGTISQIVIGLGPNNSITNEKGTFNVELQGIGTSGIKINLDEEIGLGAEKTIYLDFDLSKSIIETETGKFLIQPVVRAYSGDNTGAIEGIISPVESQPIISAIIGNDIKTTKTDNDGYFCISGLVEGIYDLNITPEESFLEQTIQNINVLHAATANVGTIVIKNNEQIAGTIKGDLNINPASSDDMYFILQTPSSLIDINVLLAQGDLYTYTGPATSIKIVPKAQGASINIDGSNVTLDKDIRYTFQSNNTPMNVNLRNVRNGNGNWWIALSGENVSISPMPNTQK